MQQTQLEFPPAARRTDNAASHRAEERTNKSWRQHDIDLVVMALYAWGNITSKDLAGNTGLDRHMVARRLPDLLKNGLAERVDSQEGWRWSLTLKGVAQVARINGRNRP